MNQLSKQDATEAVHAALDSLFEATVLRSIDTSTLGETQIQVLNNIVGERARNAYDDIYHVYEYFGQKPKTKKRKLAVVKKAA